MAGSDLTRLVEALSSLAPPSGDGEAGADLRRTLNALPAVQKATVDSLYFFYGQRLSDLNTDFQPRFGAVISDFRAELRQILTEDQRVTYDLLVLEQEADHTSRHRNNRDR